MTNLHLIAHKVRGEPAFDIAERIECAMCDGHGDIPTGECFECNGLGFWWIIPTSGHRAYPYWHVNLEDIDEQYILILEAWKDGYQPPYTPPPIPEGLQDHYHLTVEPSRTNPLDAILPKAPPRTIVRRI